MGSKNEPLSTESCQENDSSSVKVVSPGKKRNRKKKNVAITSIQNLTTSKDVSEASANNHKRNQNDELPIREVGHSKTNSESNSNLLLHPNTKNQAQNKGSQANGQSPKKVVNKVLVCDQEPQRFCQQNSRSPLKQMKVSVSSFLCVMFLSL